MSPLFVIVLACVSVSYFWKVKEVGAMLAAPSITFEPEQTVYISGADTVTLRCVAPSPSKVKGYTLHQNGVLRASFAEEVYMIQPVMKDHEGSYFCTYYAQKGNNSLESATRTLKVTERPPTPEITFRPHQHPVYMKGKEVSVLCTGSKLTSGVYFHFYKDRKRLTEDGGQLENVHRIPALAEGNAGVYTCQYGTESFGRAISTLESAPRALIALDPLPVPLLSILPSPAVEGKQATVKCDAPSASTVNGYRFYKDGREITEPQGSAQDVFILNKFSSEDQGSYFCLYWKNISGTEIRSPESQRLQLDSEGNVLETTVPTTENGHSLSSLSATVYLIFFGGKLLVLVIVLLIFGSCQIHQCIKMKAQKEDQ